MGSDSLSRNGQERRRKRRERNGKLIKNEQPIAQGPRSEYPFAVRTHKTPHHPHSAWRKSSSEDGWEGRGQRCLLREGNRGFAEWRR